ncbi:DUF5134 domain-containing protein [Streptomyces sp. H27-C3]|uniref:DUF5134 domain-containing protein n=1 Tax=Streptomyces sp. H27-C3 TaxID=3046305 RepID=UPI0024B9B00F|nr:DUF5134 domain-containing protein [Streptomyces sp. H27-C3]MDJ0463741.1 DUF5134 domain-containing protein [Streptomyces sp. H27-C3]
MHGEAMSGWLLVALCAATGAYCLLRMSSGAGEHRTGAGSEALMGFGMAAMALPAAAIAPPVWGWALYAAVFGVAALWALGHSRGSTHHLHHVIGSAAMVYMALVMAPGAGSSAHTGHTTGYGAGGIPLLTGALLLYYAGYVLRSGVRLMPVSVVARDPESGVAVAWGARPELALACRLSMGIGMIAMLLTL